MATAVMPLMSLGRMDRWRRKFSMFYNGSDDEGTKGAEIFFPRIAN